MAYLFLSFTEHIDKTNNLKNEYYNLSLNEQFALLEKRLSLEKQVSSLQNFIETCFPSGLTKKYYISCPNFLREKEQRDSNAPSYLRNVVVRPELTLSMKSVLPDNQNIILIGDIYESNKAKVLQIKGIQFIDSSMSSINDIVILAEACNSFTRSQSMSRMGQMVSFNVWSIDRVDMSNTVFSPNFVFELIQNCYTVSHPEQIRATYEEWNKYINFRNYYLTEQSKRNFKLDRAVFVKAYAVNKKDYKKNSTIYDEYLLDGLKEFTYGDMVCLNTQIEDAEEFPLIRLDIERNKKIFNESKVTKCGKLVNEEERKIRSLASDNVFITATNPNSMSKFKDNKGNSQTITFTELLNVGYALGDRFKIVSYDILPDEHLQKLDHEYETNINTSYKNIDAKYEKIINNEVDNAVNSFKAELQNQHNISINKKEKELRDLLLDNDVIEKLKDSAKVKIIRSNSIAKQETKEHYDYRINKLLEKEYSEIEAKAKKQYNSKLNDFKKSLDSKFEIEIINYKNKKKTEISNKYKDDIRNEKISVKEQLDTNLKEEKDHVKDEETVIRFSLYFCLGDPNNVISDKQIKIISDCNYIVYDNRADKAKITRQEQALKNFYSGYVKNPYLSTYLFNPQGLNTISAEVSDWVWHLDSLNDKQKEAVRKAVSSNGLFLLQGPPGTGKTQVIAETVAQLVKKGKKVLISSETHKAIDNVFERLPKIAEIVPIRLIPSNNNKKDNEYDPKFLVDNFYMNVSANMKKTVEKYKNFEKNKEDFSENYERLNLLKSKIDKNQHILEKAKNDIEVLENKTTEINSKIDGLSDKKDSIRIDLDILRRTKRYIENDNLRPDEDVKTDIILDYRKALVPLFDYSIYCNIDLSQLLKNINALRLDEAERELSVINPDSNRTILEIRRDELKNELNNYTDELGDVIDESYNEKVIEIKKELRTVLNELKADVNVVSANDLKLTGIFNYSYMVANIASICDTLKSIKDRLLEFKSSYIEEINGKISSTEDRQKSVDNEINDLKKEIRKLNDSIIEIQERSDVKEIQESKFKLETELLGFFRTFEISEPFKDIDEALEIVKRKWYELENDFDVKEKENKEKIPMYEKISNYLTSEDVIEEDRKTFTKDLFENANVFGITCTSNDKFSGKTVDALSEYNIEDIDIKNVGIDVVIIDEVSKSSFIDLLIPILYGKTVILVGDHRQLPPMYEFSKLRNDDFEGLDETIINPDINREFTNLYEECFFKTLFEKIPNSYKTMLIQQYRCHEDIMRVFNHFYRNELKLGWEGQNNSKRHNVKLLSNGRNIIEPDKHVYFVNCKQNETHEADSTSMYNTGEAKVVVELIKKLNNYFKQNPERERLSIGVICTYGDQARKIKDLLKSEKVKTDAFKTDTEKMIVSTVDDFQGDERDIIIFSTVRNPEDPRRSNPGFILAYQRINVALSRARRMLIMVGNRKYLEEKGVIDLPDIYGIAGFERRNFRVYEEILATIEKYGKVIDDVDVLDDKEAKING